MQTPWLSIVIPVYNAELYLARCLDSILAQTYRDFEVILVDDGSTDRSPQICSDYASTDHRIRYFRKENRGPLHSRTFGAKHAAGIYVTFCDADDYYVTGNAFSRIYEELREETYSILQFGKVKKYNHLKRRCRSVEVPETVARQDFLTREYPKFLCSFWDEARIECCVWDKVYHRDMVAELPELEERIFWGDDLIMDLFLCASCNSFRMIPDALYCYCALSGGTNRFSVNAMKDLDVIKRYQLHFLDQYQEGAKEKMLRILHSEVAGWFFLHVCQALECLDDREIRKMITETLALQSFLLSREYYAAHMEENSEVACLLRKADVDAYIEKAREKKRRINIKESIKQFLRHIYISI